MNCFTETLSTSDISSYNQPRRLSVKHVEDYGETRTLMGITREEDMEENYRTPSKVRG